MAKRPAVDNIDRVLLRIGDARMETWHREFGVRDAEPLFVLFVTKQSHVLLQAAK